MDSSLLIFSLLIQTVLTLLGLFLITYVQQKSKNLATKEDIAEITKQIELVKNIYKQAYDLLSAERKFYDELILVTETFLAEIKRHELKTNSGPDSLTKDKIMGNDDLREKFLNFIDKANVILAKSFVFLSEESYTNFKNVFEKQTDFAHIRINLLDAMRKSVYPNTKLKAIKDSKNISY